MYRICSHNKRSFSLFFQYVFGGHSLRCGIYRHRKTKGQGKLKVRTPRCAHRIGGRVILTTHAFCRSLLSKTFVVSIIRGKWNRVWAPSVTEWNHYAKAFITQVTREPPFFTGFICCIWFILDICIFNFRRERIYFRNKNVTMQDTSTSANIVIHLGTNIG